MKSSSFTPYAPKGLDSVQMNINLLLRQKEFKKKKCKGTYLSLSHTSKHTHKQTNTERERGGRVNKSLK